MSSFRNRSTIEALEGRTLLSAAPSATADAADADAPLHAGADVDAVDLNVRGKSLVRSGKAYMFKVVYSGEAAIDVDSVRHVLVTGPSGYDAEADVLRVKSAKGGTKLVSTYRAHAARGAWDVADAGPFTASLASADADAPARTLTTFTVDSRRPIRSDLIDTLPAADFAAELTSVYPWCDHMPIVGEWPGPRQYLLLEVKLTNSATESRTVSLDDTTLAFDNGPSFHSTAEVSIRDERGLPTGEDHVVLLPGETRAVKFRSNGAFPEGNDGRRLCVTLKLSSGGTTVILSGEAMVITTS